MKLWVSPAPTDLKNNVEESVLAPPTNVPVVPSPTLMVAIPIRSSDIFATNKVWPSDKVVPTPTFVSSWTMIPDPPVPGEYVIWSPVLRLWFLIKILLDGINACVIPDPGFAKEIVVPIPTPAVVPKPTALDGSK